MAEEQQTGQKQPSFLAKIYYGLEDTYYKIMEFFQNKLHIPLVKGFVEPIEKHNIPSMPVALLILIAIVGGLFFAFGGGFALPAQKIPFTVSVMAADGTPLDGASVTLSGTGFKDTVTSANGLAEFVDVPKGALLLLTIKKDGYTTITKRITVSEKGYEAKMATSAVAAANPAKDYLKGQGYNTNQVASMSDTDAEKLAAGLGYQKSSVQVNVGVKVIDSSSNAPLEGASVNYEPGSGTEYSGSDGVASFQVPDTSTVSISASKDGYNPGISSFTAEDGYVSTVRLTKRTSPSKPAGSDKPATSTDPVTTSNVIVVVKGVDSAGKSVPVSHANVMLKLSDNTDLGNVPEVASDSPVTFSAIPVGAEVVVVVTANGFSATKTAKKTVETGKDLSITATLTLLPPCPSNNCTTGEMDFQVSVKDDKNRSISAAKVFLLDEDDAVLKNATTDANGIALMKAEAGTFARIFVTSDKYLSVYSDDLELGIDNNFNASLVLGTANNSATLSIKVTEFDGKAAPGAFTTVSVTASGLRKIMLPIQKLTSTSGVADYTTLFPLGWKAAASAVGANLGFSGDAQEITLQAGKNNVTITLLPNQKVVTFKAVDVYTKDPVPANFTTYLRNSNVVLASCEQTTQAGCVQTIYANVDYDLKVTSLTHLGRTVQIPKLSTDPNTDNTIVVDLLPSTLPQTTFVGLCKSADLQTDCESTAGDYGTLQVGQTYYAKFLVKIANGSDSYGFIVRAGDKSGLFADDAAIVRSQATLTTDSIWSESANNTILAARGQPKTGCGGTETSNGLYKVVSLTSKNVNQPAAEVVVPFIVTSKTRPSFKIYYEAWNRVNGSYIREPQDNAFQDAALPASSWCSPAMVNISYNRVDDTMDPQAYPNTTAPKHHFLCGPQACLELRYSQKISDGSVNHGGNGFVVDVPYTPATEPVSITYKLTDFDPDPEEFSTLFTLTAPATKLAFQTPNPYVMNYSGAPFGGQSNIGGGTASDTITAWPIEAGAAILQSTYGTKLPLMESAMLLTSKFRGTVENTYYVHYNADTANLEIGVKNETNDFVPRNAITLNTSPVMPADAVYLKIDYDSMPAECTDAQIQFMPLPACFSFDNTQEILKFDASSSVIEGSECPYYDKNPNHVKSTDDVNTAYPNDLQSETLNKFTQIKPKFNAEPIRFALFCTGLNAKEFPATVTPDNSQQALTLVRIPARAEFSAGPAYSPRAGAGPAAPKRVAGEAPTTPQYWKGEGPQPVNRTVFAPIMCGKNLGYSYAPDNNDPNSITFKEVGNANKWNRQMSYGSKWSDVFRCRLDPTAECSLDSDVTGTGGSTGNLDGESNVFNNDPQQCRFNYNLNTYGVINSSAEYMPFAKTISNISTPGYSDLICGGPNIQQYFNPQTIDQEQYGGAFWRVSSDGEAYDYLKTDSNESLRQQIYNQAPGIYVLVNNRQYGTIDRIRVLVDNFPLTNPAQETVYTASRPGIIAVFAAFNTTPMINVSVGDLPTVINQAYTYPKPPGVSEYPFINYATLQYDPSYIGSAKKYVDQYVNHNRGTTADLNYRPFPLAAFTTDPTIELHWFTDNSASMRIPVVGAPLNGEGLFDFSQTITQEIEGNRETSFPVPKMTPLRLSQYGGPLQLACSNPVETTLLGRNFFILNQADGTKCIQSSWDAQHKVFGDPVSAPCNDDCVLDDQCNANNSQYTLKVAFLTGEGYVCMRDNPVGFEDVVPHGACLKVQGGGIKGTDFSAYGPDGKKLVEMDPNEWKGLDDNSRAEYVMEVMMAHPDLARLMADLGDKNSPQYKPMITTHTLSVPTAGNLDDAIDSDAAVYLGADYKLSVHYESNRDYSDECYYLPAANEYYCPKNNDYQYARYGFYGALGLGSALCTAFTAGACAGLSGWAWAGVIGGAAAVGEGAITGAETHNWKTAIGAGVISGATTFAAAGLGQYVTSAIGGNGFKAIVGNAKWGADSWALIAGKSALYGGLIAGSGMLGSMTACYATGGGSSCWVLARERDVKGDPLFYESSESATASMQAYKQQIMFADETTPSATADDYLARLSTVLSPNQTRFFTDLRESMKLQVNETNYNDVINGVGVTLLMSSMGADYLLENYTFPSGKTITKEHIQKDRDFLEQVITMAENAQTQEQAADLLTVYVMTSPVINEVNSAYNQAEHLNQRYLTCAQKKQSDPERYASTTCPPCVLKDRCQLPQAA